MPRSLRVTSVRPLVTAVGREQAVDDRDRPEGVHASPLVGDRIVDTQHATVERGSTCRSHRSSAAALSGFVAPIRPKAVPVILTTPDIPRARTRA